jgi:hypothetical protein
MVWDGKRRLGNNATRIADDMIARAFPRTVEEAALEGADKMLRSGVISEVKRILTKNIDDDETIDMATIDPTFGEIVTKLKKGKYFVEEAHGEPVNEYVSVADLINDPGMLDSARKLMRRKGEECLAEAKVLDELYAAVTR